MAVVRKTVFRRRVTNLAIALVVLVWPVAAGSAAPPRSETYEFDTLFFEGKVRHPGLELFKTRRPARFDRLLVIRIDLSSWIRQRARAGTRPCARP